MKDVFNVHKLIDLQVIFVVRFLAQTIDKEGFLLTELVGGIVIPIWALYHMKYIFGLYWVILCL